MKRPTFSFRGTIFVAVAVAAFVSAIVYSQPASPPGLQKVAHDTTLKGSGTNGAPLGLAFCGAGSAWVMNGGGTAWTCAAPGTSGALTGVYHDTTLAGSGSSGSTLGIALCGAGSAWVMNSGGTAYACTPMSTAAGVYHDSTLAGSGSSGSTLGMSTCGANQTRVMNSSGTAWTCSVSNSLASASESISISAAVTGTTTVALDTIGTIDWIYQSSYWGNSLSDGGGIPTGCQATAGGSNSCQMKNSGGGQLAAAGMQWLSPPGSPTSTTSGTTFTSGSADNTAGVALSSTVYKCAASATFPTGNWGFKFNLPSPGNGLQRVARIYLFQYDDSVTCTATIADGTGTSNSATNNTGSGSVANTVTWTVTYKTNYATPVSVECRTTVLNSGTGNPATCWGAITLSPT